MIEEGKKPAGRHTATLVGAGLESGVYFYTLQAGGFTNTRRMLISR
jgi:hypothetical protein